MDTNIFLEMYEIIASYLRILPQYYDVYNHFYNALVVYGVLVLVIGYAQNQRLTLILTYTLVTLLITYLMRDVLNTGYVVTSFSLVALLAAFITYNKKLLNYSVFIGVLTFYMMRLMGLNHWIGLIVVMLLIPLTFRYLPTITILLISTLFGSIVLAQYLSETYVASFTTFFVIAFVFGMVVQVLTIGILSLNYEIKMLFGKESRGDI